MAKGDWNVRAPAGQAFTQAQHFIHRAASVEKSSRIAPVGHICRHSPHSTHLSESKAGIYTFGVLACLA